MSATPRELVLQTLRFEAPTRAPRHLWTLPASQRRYPAEMAALAREYPNDIRGVDAHQRVPCPTRGNRYAVGTFTDEWNCRFTNLQDGIIGEVKHPPVADWETDRGRIRIPREMMALVRDMHAFYCDLLTAFAQTDVDGLGIADDWGSQRSLLISPAMWRERFKPLYRDYAQIAHAAGKAFFMHSDGFIVDIYPDLVEIGVDALNSQIFCMGVDRLVPFAGRITFWRGDCGQANGADGAGLWAAPPIAPGRGRPPPRPGRRSARRAC